MSWWNREHERIDPRPADPSWRLPKYNNPQPLGRLREKLWEIVSDDDHGEAWFNALAREIRPAGAISRFLEGDDEVLTPEQLAMMVAFEGDFGRDGRTDRLIRHPREAAAGISVDPAPVRPWRPLLWLWSKTRAPVETERVPYGPQTTPPETRPTYSEEIRRRSLANINPAWK